MAERLLNSVSASINMAAGIGSTDTSITVDDATPFGSGGNFRAAIDSEIVLVTGIAANVLTVTRGQEGTTATAHANGTLITVVLSAGGLEQYITENAGGGGGGMTNPMTTAGDIIIGGSGGAAGRLGIGSAGQVLEVVSGAPAWATPVGTAGLDVNTLAIIKLSAAVTVSHQTFQQILLDSVVGDPGSNYDSSAHKYIVPSTGYYLVNAWIRWADAAPAGVSYSAQIGTSLVDTDGSVWTGTIAQASSPTVRNSISGSQMLHLTAADALMLFLYWDGSSNQSLVGAKLSIVKLS